MRVIVLGATGMLGQAIVKEGLTGSFDVVPVSRSGGHRWDAYTESFSALAEDLGIAESDWVINCIGWIPQKASGIAKLDSTNAARLNSSLLGEISAERARLGFGWIQIATDCVFSGKSGPNGESRDPDPIDLYGRTKALGELASQGAIQIRCSIVGPDVVSKSGLFEWFRSLPFGAEVPGYVNHFWNGVSTLVFAKLCFGVIRGNRRDFRRHHFVPADGASKYELLCIFRDLLGRGDLTIVPTASSIFLDRRLISDSPELNQELWELAGYSGPIGIEEMCREFIGIDAEG